MLNEPYSKKIKHTYLAATKDGRRLWVSSGIWNGGYGDTYETWIFSDFPEIAKTTQTHQNSIEQAEKVHDQIACNLVFKIGEYLKAAGKA